MPLVDPNLLLQQGNPLQEGIAGGMKLRQQYQQGQDDDKTRKAMETFQTLAQGQDITTKEGLTKVLQGMTQAGHADAAFKIFEANKDMFVKPAPNSYTPIQGTNGVAAFNQQTGEVKAPPGFTTKEQEARQADEKFAGMKATLDSFMTPKNPDKGWNPLTGEKAMALKRVSDYIPADVRANSAAAQKWMDDHNKEQQQQVFNPAMGGLMDARMKIGTMSDWRPIRNDYEKQSKAYVQAEGIIKSARFGKDQIGDVSLLNQLAQAETGSKPTDAEYRQMETSPGPIGKIAQAYNTVKSGTLLKPETVKSIMAEFRSQQRIRHEGYQASILEKQDEARMNGLNPGLITPGGIYQQVEKLKSGWDSENPDAAGADPALIDLAKKALADPKATPEHVAAAKKILGLK